jgi:hypothetical protein
VSGRLKWSHALALVAVCAAIYGFGLSWRSFASSEGHRVAPGWELLDPPPGHEGGWWHITLFEQTYLRKPPGMPWAIAAMSSVLGQTEIAARSVSAIAMTLSALAAWWFASRWFGARYGIAAGLALATMPQLWAVGRSAEIEALNNLGVLLSGLAIVDVALAGGRMGRRIGVVGAGAGPGVTGAAIAGRIGPAGGTEEESPTRSGLVSNVLVVLLGAAGVVIAVLAKGPAGAPVVGGVLIAAAVLRMWTLRGLAGVVAIGAVAAAVLVPVGRRVLAANADPMAITQGTDDFLWSKGVAPVLMLLPMALFSALPAALAMMFPWGKEASEEARTGGRGAERALRAARLLGTAWMCSLGIMMAIGVSNPRYAMPASGLLCPMVCYAVRGAWGVSATFNAKRRHLVKRLTLGNLLAVPVLLTCAAVLSTVAARNYKIGVDGREAGLKLAGLVQGAGAAGTAPVEVWADGLVEARPDVLLYARKAAARHGMAMRPLWKKREMGEGREPVSGAVLVLRIDGEGDERGKYEAAIVDGRLIAAGDGEVGRYKFRVYRAR